MRILLLFTTLTAPFVFVAAQKREWREVKERNTIEAYEQFIVDWSTSEQVAQAHQRRCELFSAALASHFSFDLMIKQYLPSRLDLIGHGILERASCHNGFLALYEEEAYAQAMASDSIGDPVMFGVFWPGSAHMEEVAEHAYGIVLRSDSLRPYRAFMSAFPRSRRMPVIMDRYCQLRTTDLESARYGRAQLLEYLRTDSCRATKQRLEERLRTLDAERGIDRATWPSEWLALLHSYHAQTSGPDGTPLDTLTGVTSEEQFLSDGWHARSPPLHDREVVWYVRDGENADYMIGRLKEKDGTKEARIPSYSERKMIGDMIEDSGRAPYGPGNMKVSACFVRQMPGKGRPWTSEEVVREYDVVAVLRFHLGKLLYIFFTRE